MSFNHRKEAKERQRLCFVLPFFPVSNHAKLTLTHYLFSKCDLRLLSFMCFEPVRLQLASLVVTLEMIDRQGRKDAKANTE
jgi:hypothetical protein